MIVLNSNLNSKKLDKQETMDRTKDVEIMVALKYLSNFRIILEMSLNNCEISLQLKYYRKYIIVASTANNQSPSFQINDTKLYVSVVILSTHENMKLLKQYLAKTTNQTQNIYLDYLTVPGFEGVNRHFILAFEVHNGRESLSRYYLPTVEMKDYNVMIDGKNLMALERLRRVKVMITELDVY